MLPSKLFKRLTIVILILISRELSFALLSTPSITTPINNSKNVLNKVSVSTNLLSGTNFYRFEYDSVSTFNSGYRKRLPLSTANSHSIDSLPFNTNHYIRLKVFNSTRTDSSDWSAVVKFTTFNSVTNFYTTPSYALLNFNWTTNTVNKIEIEIDTSQSFNSKRLMQYRAATPSVGTYNFKYTKSYATYYIRYRSRYGSKYSAWFDAGTAYSNNGFVLQTSYLMDSFILKKPIVLSTNYDGDTNVVYTIWIDTSKNFNSPELIKYDTIGSRTDFYLKSARTYYLKVRMAYLNDSFYQNGGAIQFKTAKYAPKYSTIGGPGYINFVMYPDFTQIFTEMDTTPLFNSAMKIYWDTTLNPSIFTQSFYKKYLNIKKYHKMYLRYRTAGPRIALDWYSTYERFLVPSYSFYAVNPPKFANNNISKFEDQSGVICEIDTSLRFNSKQKFKFSGNLTTLDSIKTLKFGWRYYGRYKSYNATGDTTGWGKPLAFNILDTVRIASPSSKTFEYPNVSLWSDEYPGIKLYQWQLDTFQDFKTAKNIFLNTGRYTDGSYMTLNKRYFWRMRLISVVDTSKWSRSGFFDYLSGYALPLPFLIHPPDKATKIAPGEVSFLWKDNSAGKASEYEFYLSEPGKGKVTAIVESNKLVLKDLKPATTYTWYVRSAAKSPPSMPINSAVKFTFTTAASASAELPKNSGLSLYPNPAGSKIQVSTEHGDKIKFIAIYSTLGKEIFKISDINSQAFELDISDLPTGLYYVSCQSDARTYTSKLIKE
jgi:hypothetical protein